MNFGSVGEFDGLVIKDNYPLGVNVTGIQWRLTGAVASRHFEVLTGNSTGVGTWVDTGIAQKPGQWHDVVADINVVTQSWTFSVDGVGFNQTMGFIGAPPQLNSVYYYDTAAGSVDSIIVRATPEPGTPLTLFAAGALLLLRHRSARSMRSC